MKALQFTEPFKMQKGEIEYPKINEDEVVVKVHYCGICKTDIELLNGTMPHIVNGNTKYPLVPGHEWSGEIVEKGSNVTDFEIGDKIVGDVSLGCGCCDMCREGHFNLCPNREVIGSYRNRQGGFAQYIRTHRRHIYKVPEGVSMQHAAVIEPTATAAYAVKRSNVKYGDNVLVIGDGPIGLLTLQCANAAGAANVAIIGSWEEKLEIALKTGANLAVSYKDSTLDAKVQQYSKEKLGGNLFDVVIDTSGNKAAINQAIKYAKPTGTIGLLSFYDGDVAINMNDVITKDLEVNGVLASLNMFRPTLDMISSGKIDLDSVITGVYDYEDVEKAFADVLDRSKLTIKVLIKMI